MDKKYLENIIIKFLNNEASSEEKAILKEAIQSEENLELFQSYIQANHLLEKEFTSFDSKEALYDFEKEIEKDTVLKIDWKRKSNQVLKYAAVVAIGVFVSLTLYLNNGAELKNDNEITLELNDGTKKTIKSVDIQNILNSKGEVLGVQNKGKLIYDDTDSDRMELVYNKLYVPYGKKFQIELSDGSAIHLNSGSTLKYPVQFIKGKSREVFLDGEAYFKVAKNKEDSFIVYANELNTEVYGTEFNVSAYKSDNHTKVVLVEGSVGVSANKPNISNTKITMLNPLEKAEWNLSSQAIVKEVVDVEKFIAWKDGVLMFDNERFEVIIKKLERHFNVAISNNFEEINNNRYTGVFDIESLEEILEAFSKHKTFEYKHDNNQITINKPE